MRKFAIPLILLFTMISSCSNKVHAPLPVVDSVNINRYLGRWYEIARLPNRFERGLTCVTATYTLKTNGKIEVLNAGRKLEDTQVESKAKGVAWIPNPKVPGKLKVRFFWPFSGKYWILALDKDYRWAMVGDDSRKYLWILSRTPTLDQSTIDMLLKQVQQQGFDAKKMEFIDQGCFKN
jgi:Bacterial lipocalin